MSRSTARNAAAVGAALLAAVLTTAPVEARPSAMNMPVTLKDFTVVLPAMSMAPGTVTFKVTNRGAVPHDFRVAGKSTPILKHGATAMLMVRFAKPGRYPFSCTVAGHAAMGMKGVLTVR